MRTGGRRVEDVKWEVEAEDRRGGGKENKREEEEEQEDRSESLRACKMTRSKIRN
jgi:hypothetical protein